MPLKKITSKLQGELEAKKDARYFGSGWISGVLALIASLSGLTLIVALRHPTLFMYPELSQIHNWSGLIYLVYLALIASYVLSCISLMLRSNKILGILAMTITLAATIVGSLPPSKLPGENTGYFLGVDFFVLSILFSAFLFVPLERIIPHDVSQPIFRNEWREDLFYYFVSSLLIQLFTFLALMPSEFLLSLADWSTVRGFFENLPWVLQLGLIMFLADFVQYWVHRCFHRIPWLWKFHAIHHSIRQIDWLAGSRLHLVEIIVLRSLTATPMFLLGFEESAIQAYLLIVYVYATFIHANVGVSFGVIEKVFAVPRYHHWHHGLEKEAIDVNFAIHFPILDRIFGTLYFPKDQWPKGYGIKGHPVPSGYLKQLIYPFKGKEKLE